MYLLPSVHQVRVATHSRLTEHAKVAGSQRHTCVYKKQNPGAEQLFWQKSCTFNGKHDCISSLGVDDVCIIIVISIILSGQKVLKN